MISEMRDLLVEIGTEELPPKALEGLSEAFLAEICKGFQQQQLSYQETTAYATPRRLAVLIKGVDIKQKDRSVEKRGPTLSAAFDKQGQPTKAALGFAKSCGVEVEALEKQETPQGIWLVHRSMQRGQTTATLVPNIVETALAALPIPKRMRWGDLPFEFVRPVHWLVILLGHEIIEAEILGVRSGRETRGHRFHQPAPLVLIEAHEYARILAEKGKVIPLFSARREKIRQLIEESAKKVNGQAVIDEALLSEVTSLVEWPVPIVGSFDEKFLQVPQEALIATMKGNQKCFHLIDAQGKLLPKFIAISNIESLHPETVKTGNERVIRPRLSDAAFFWEQDRARTLEIHLDQLKFVIFQNKLGSLYDKSKRIARLTGTIAKSLGADELQGIRAALLSKCDLMTNMVSEFPELQGIMGEYYAYHDGETDSVAVALREQYMPRFWGDALPASTLGRALSIADKLDTLIGIFGIHQAPTGDKDPFGLRRATLGVLRVMIECELPLDLYQLLKDAQYAYPEGIIQAQQASEQVFDFMLERLKGYYQDKGMSHDTVEAVLVCRPTMPFDADRRIRGVEVFRNQPDFVSLASANKRIHNILKKAEEIYPPHPDPTYFNHSAERQLYDKMEEVNHRVISLVRQGDYHTALRHLAMLRERVDNFFDKVMVMDDNLTVRRNRLAFLQEVRNLFLQVADISKLQV